MKKILITGGTGLVGNAFREVVGSDPRFIFISSKDCNLLNYEHSYEKIKLISPDCVIHLAANVGGLFKNINKKVEMFEDNLLINYNILKICHQLNVNKFIGCLSTCIFPDKTEYPINEEMLFNGPPHDSNYGYAYAKRMLDVHCSVYREQYGRDYCCVIPTNVYGPHDNFNLQDAHVIPALIHKCFLAKKNNSAFVVAGTGLPQRQFLYSIDLANAILSLLDYQFQRMIIAPSKEYSIRDVGYMICDLFNYKNIEFDTSKPDGQNKKTADNSNFIGINNFEFTDMHVGLKNTIDWFLNNNKNARI